VGALDKWGVMRIDGKEHDTVIKVRVEQVKDGERVVLSLFPYSDEACAIELIMDGAGANELGRWLLGRGRDGSGRGSMFSLGRTNA